MTKTAYRDFDLRELRVLGTLLRERSITRTAEVLETTQPSISKTLRRLRAQFADPLFVRDGQRMQPTSKALDIAEQIRAVLQAADGLRFSASAFDPRQSERLFSVLVTDVGMVHFLPPIFSRLAEAAPGVRLRAVPLDSRQFDTKLEAGEADLALGAFPKAARHLRRQRLYFDNYLSVVRQNHPRIDALATRAGFLAERHLLITASDTGHAAHGGVQRALADAITAENILLRVPSFLSGVIVAAQTDSIITIPAVLARRLAAPLGLHAFTTPIDLPRIEVAQYWHERFHRDPGNRWLRGVIGDLFGNGDCIEWR